MAAAELALAINPENETAKRAVAAVTARASVAEPAPVLEVMQITGMTLAQALAVIWPFKGVNRPIGVLLEESEIALRDLAWAAENAYDARIKDAARTILLSRLLGPQLKEPPLPMKVISAWRSYSERQERVRLLFAGLVIGVVATIWILTMLFGVVDVLLSLARSSFAPALTVITAVFFVLLLGPGYLSMKLFDRMADEVEQFKKGSAGEKRVVPWACIACTMS